MARRRSRRPKPRIAAVILVIAVAVVAGFAIYLVVRPAPTPPASATPHEEVDYEVDLHAGDPLSVMVVGDSYTGGSDMNSGPTWAEQMATANGWNFIRESASGIGYLAGNPSRPGELKRVDDQIAEWSPDVVLMTLGHNDANHFPTQQIAAAAKTVLRKMVNAYPEADVVLLSPFTGGGDNPGIAALIPALATVADDLGLPYIDTSKYIDAKPRLLGSDGTHPTDAGHAEIARRLTADLTAAGVQIRLD